MTAAGQRPAGHLSVAGLSVDFPTPQGPVRAVDGIDLELPPGTRLGIVGESGSGKSVTALAIMGLLAGRRVRIGGRIAFDGAAVRQLGEPGYPGLRGREMAMIFQDAASSLNPVLDIVSQLAEVYRHHAGLGGAQARAAAVAMLGRVGIAGLGRGRRYPHHYSGGMRQRAMIATALACNPRLLIADEPTTALDVTVQAQILALLRALVAEQAATLVLISHDLGVVAGMTGRIAVMYAGRIVEAAPTDALFARPLHPYTLGLMQSIPRLDRPRRARMAAIEGQAPGMALQVPGCAFAPRCAWASAQCRSLTPPLTEVAPGRRTACWNWQRLAEARVAPPAEPLPPVRPRPASGRAAEPAAGPVPVSGSVSRPTSGPVSAAEPLLIAERLRVDYPITHHGRRLTITPVEDVSLSLRRGETLGLVGESGCGKSTLGRALLLLTRPAAGRVRLSGEDWTAATPARLRALRGQAQMIFQDPFETLDPRMTLGAALAEAVRQHRPGRPRREVAAAVEALLATVELSPRLIVADEPTSALDVSIQAQMMNLLSELQARLGLTLLFISHNLAVVRQLASRVAVMYMGRIIELADCDRLFAAPQHPYTRALIAAVPVPDPAVERARPAAGRGDEPADLAAPPPGCRFHPRCPLAMEICRSVRPPLAGGTGHLVACHLGRAVPPAHTHGTERKQDA